MSTNIQFKKTVLLITITLLFFVSLGIGWLFYQNSVKSVTQKTFQIYQRSQQNSSLTDEEKIKSAIYTYFITRYESQKLLKAQDFSPLVEDSAALWVQKEKDKREIELTIAELSNLGYQSYQFTLNYDFIKIDHDKATVQLKESHEVVFNAVSPQVSKLGDLPHIFRLQKKDEFWLISMDEYQDELSQQLNHKTKEEILEQINSKLR